MTTLRALILTPYEGFTLVQHARGAFLMTAAQGAPSGTPGAGILATVGTPQWRQPRAPHTFFTLELDAGADPCLYTSIPPEYVVDADAITGKDEPTRLSELADFIAAKGEASAYTPEDILDAARAFHFPEGTSQEFARLLTLAISRRTR